jgi:hypothetical protein
MNQNTIEMVKMAKTNIISNSFLFKIRKIVQEEIVKN